MECYIVSFLVKEDQVFIGKENFTIEIYALNCYQKLKNLIKVESLPTIIRVFSDFLFVSNHLNNIIVYDQTRNYMYIETLKSHENQVIFY